GSSSPLPLGSMLPPQALPHSQLSSVGSGLRVQPPSLPATSVRSLRRAWTTPSIRPKVSSAKVLLYTADSLLPLFSDIRLRSPSSRTTPCWPVWSNGLTVRRLTRPPIAPSVSEACAPLTTSAPLITSDGSTSKAKSRPAPSV